MKVGDKVVCIKDCFLEGKGRFVADRFYFIREFEFFSGYDLIRIDSVWFARENISDLWFSEYFQTLPEYREKRIDDIFE